MTDDKLITLGEMNRREKLREQLFSYFDVSPSSPRLEELREWGYDRHVQVLYGGDLGKALDDYISSDNDFIGAVAEGVADGAEVLTYDISGMTPHELERYLNQEASLDQMSEQAARDILYDLEPREREIYIRLRQSEHYAQIARRYEMTMDEVSDVIDSVVRKLDLSES